MKTKPKNLSATSSSAPPRANLSGWQTVKLGEVCEFQRGLTYAKGDEVASSSNIVLRANNIDLATNLLDLTELKYIRDAIEIPPAKLVKPGSLMICTASGSKTHLGKVALIEEDYGYAFGGFMGLLTARAGVVPNYLFHLMTSPLYKSFIAELSDGANINNLKFDDLAEFAIPLPPLPEQRRIVGILDEALAGIAVAKAHAERNRQNARALFESHLHAVFSHPSPDWGETPFEECIDRVRYSAKIQRKDFLAEGPFAIVSQEAGSPNGFWDKEADVFRHDKPVVIFGDHTRVLKYVDFDFVLGADGVKILQPADILHPKFFFHQLCSIDLPSLGYARHYRLLAEQVLRYPPIKEQQRIAAELDALAAETRRLEGLYERKAAALDELKQSLLHQAFSGQL